MEVEEAWSNCSNLRGFESVNFCGDVRCSIAELPCFLGELAWGPAFSLGSFNIPL